LDGSAGGQRTFLVLLEGSRSLGAARALDRIAPPGTRALIPPLAGLRFLAATGGEAAELDAWWQRAAGGQGRPVVLIAHHDELPQRLSGLDADFVIAVPGGPAQRLYDGLPNVVALVTEDPSQLAEAAVRISGLDAPSGPVAPPDPFQLLAAAGDLEPPEGHQALNRQNLLGRHRPARGGRRPVPTVVSLGHLFDRLAQLRRPVLGEQLGQVVLAHKPVVAAVVSRKGGVGKTASAAAVAALLGEALDAFGHTAALVDANIGNPDAWGRLEVRGEPVTVRQILARLMQGQEPPSPAYAETPALAIYPESREVGEGYSPAQVQRLAGYLRGRHAAVVVDLPNRLPAFTSAEAAIAAAWIAEAGVVVVPTTADPAALLGVTEYLGAESMRGKPVVVPYIVPRLREIRTAPQVRELLERIRAEGATIVEVPDDDRATLALIRRTAISEAGLSLRQAYVALATRVVEAATRAVDPG
jgi:MinD-like ATPase involved in chromosome partitioning or flagellar assembly